MINGNWRMQNGHAGSVLTITCSIQFAFFILRYSLIIFSVVLVLRDWLDFAVTSDLAMILQS